MNNNKQTAVEQLWQDLKDILPSSVDTETGIKLVRAFHQAKEMENQQKGYSEEEVLSFGKFCIGKVADFLDGKGDQTDGKEYSMKELLEQFKKK